MPTLKLGFFASGGGSNVQAILDAIESGRLDAEARIIISNNSKAYVLERARIAGVPFAHISSKTHDDEQVALIQALQTAGAEIVVLAGYMKKISPELIRSFDGRVLNIHPALLPKFGGKGMYGMNVHKAVIEAGEKVSGPTIHLVNEKYDAGRILAQREVPVLPNDSPETLAARVLEAEHIIYAETLRKIALGEIVI